MSNRHSSCESSNFEETNKHEECDEEESEDEVNSNAEETEDDQSDVAPVSPRQVVGQSVTPVQVKQQLKQENILAFPAVETTQNDEFQMGSLTSVHSLEGRLSPEAFTPQAKTTNSLWYKDFMPEIVDPRLLLRNPEFETFSACVSRANQWLSHIPQAFVMSCETVRVRADNSGNHSPEMTSRSNGNPILLLSGLRIWYRPVLTEEAATLQEICYINVPAAGTKSSDESYDREDILPTENGEYLGETITRANISIQKHKLGMILSVETLHVFKKDGDDIALSLDDTCFFSKRASKFKGTFVSFLRVFALKDLSANPEVIDCCDFVPEMSGDKTKSVEELLTRAGGWCVRQRGMRFINIQTLVLRVTKQQLGNILSVSQTMASHESLTTKVAQVRIIRMYFSKLYDPVLTRIPGPSITFRTFTPLQVCEPERLSEYETMEETMTRINQWIEITKVRVTGVETIPIEHGNKPPMERLISVGSGSKTSCFLRFYFDGPFDEPDVGSVTQNAKTCTIM